MIITTFKLFEEKYTTINSGELGNNWSAEYLVNKKQGKNPYIKYRYGVIPCDPKRSNLKDAIYITDEEAETINNAAEEMRNAEELYKSVVGKILPDLKKPRIKELYPSGKIPEGLL